MRELITDLEKYVQLRHDLTSEHRSDFMKVLSRVKNSSSSVMPDNICEAFILWAERAQPDKSETPEKSELHNILYARLCESYKTVLARFEKRADFFETLEKYVAKWKPQNLHDKKELQAYLRDLKLTIPAVFSIRSKLIAWADEKFKGNDLFVLDEDKDELFFDGLHKLLREPLSAEAQPELFRRSPEKSPVAQQLKERFSPTEDVIRVTPDFSRTKG